MTTQEQPTTEQEPTQEEMDQMHHEWMQEQEEEERWMIDEMNGEHQYDPPYCFEDSKDFHNQFLSPKQRREEGKVNTTYSHSVDIDELPF